MEVEKIYESPWQIPLHNRDKRKPIDDLTYEHAPKRTVSIAVITYASVDDATTFTMGNKYQHRKVVVCQLFISQLVKRKCFLTGPKCRKSVFVASWL